MDVTPLIRRDTQVIQNYRGGFFKISGQVYNHPVIVTQSHVAAWGDGLAIMPQDIHIDHFKGLDGLSGDIDIVLLGTGKTMARLPDALRRQVKALYGISVDSMDTGAACRTYNVLLSVDIKEAFW